jgi:hypothetical protein
MIEFAKRGERDPTRLRESVLKSLAEPALPRWRSPNIPLEILTLPHQLCAPCAHVDEVIE